ncbi:uncharacterized protein LOC129576774 [Sitodiplosis mosellana]|uniref:uncharacterized protein LOC129576774 n=1 Tax=Sitodiplosis mosellana TaxID=263140 RepID=UPI002443E390|nr:uncharacterized protein LOC129576774 [Sitodiplosis mosellana]
MPTNSTFRPGAIKFGAGNSTTTTILSIKSNCELTHSPRRWTADGQRIKYRRYVISNDCRSLTVDRDTNAGFNMLPHFLHEVFDEPLPDPFTQPYAEQAEQTEQRRQMIKTKLVLERQQRRKNRI